MNTCRWKSEIKPEEQKGRQAKRRIDRQKDEYIDTL